jgi:hydroxymethylpyrimidine/phosphomethylpyrimidine kinase
MRIALTIAGSDSGGGAGIQADLKTFHQFGVFGTTVLTAVTAQNTIGVTTWEPVSIDLVRAQLEVLATDLPPHAVKSGMLASVELVDAVADGLDTHSFPHYVLDPVMVATSGDRLLHREAEVRIADRLLPMATLVTPNRYEAEMLAGHQIGSMDDMSSAGRALLGRGAHAVLIKGGHFDGEEVVDVLVTADGVRRFTHRRLATRSTHGTGCTLSAGIAACLARGLPLDRAVEASLDFTHRAIAAAPGLGAGHGPRNRLVEPPEPLAATSG